MIHRQLDLERAKGWYAGPWDSAAPVPIGYANAGIDERHFHSEMFEVYMIARGTSTAVVEGAEVLLQAGDMLVVEPGETHTFTQSSDNYLHFVIQTPFVKGDKTLVK